MGRCWVNSQACLDHVAAPGPRAHRPCSCVMARPVAVQQPLRAPFRPASRRCTGARSCARTPSGAAGTGAAARSPSVISERPTYCSRTYALHARRSTLLPRLAGRRAASHSPCGLDDFLWLPAGLVLQRRRHTQSTRRPGDGHCVRLLAGRVVGRSLPCRQRLNPAAAASGDGVSSASDEAQRRGESCPSYTLRRREQGRSGAPAERVGARVAFQ